MDEKLKSENMLKKSIFSSLLRNAPFRGQIFKIFFASGGKGASVFGPPDQNPADDLGVDFVIGAL